MFNRSILFIACIASTGIFATPIAQKPKLYDLSIKSPRNKLFIEISKICYKKALEKADLKGKELVSWFIEKLNIKK